MTTTTISLEQAEVIMILNGGNKKYENRHPDHCYYYDCCYPLGDIKNRSKHLVLLEDARDNSSVITWVCKKCFNQVIKSKIQHLHFTIIETK